MNQYNQNENKEELKTNKQPVKSDSDLSNDRLNMLRIKYYLQDQLQHLKQTDKQELLKKYHELYGNQFGDLTMTKEERLEYTSLENNFEKKAAKKTEKELEKVHFELMKAPPVEKFHGFPAQPINKNESLTVPSSTEVRVAVSLLPAELQAIFTEYFSIHLAKNNWEDPTSQAGNRHNDLVKNMSGGAVVEKHLDHLSGKNKFRILLDEEAFYQESTKTYAGEKFVVLSFNRARFLYIVTRAILSTIGDKKEFEEILKKQKLDKKHYDTNCQNSDDWLSYFLVNGENAKKFNPELYQAAMHWLKGNMGKTNAVNTDSSPDRITIKPPKINPEKTKTVTWKTSTGEEITGGWATTINLLSKVGLGQVGGFFYGMSDYIQSIELAYQEGYLMHTAEEDGKEIKKLESRNLGCGDYVKMLKLPKYYNNKEKMRQLLFVIAGKSAFRWQFAQLWLLKFDTTFERTKGKEVSVEGFDFITRLYKAQAKAMGALNTIEYKQVGNKFKRVSFEDQVNRLDTILETFSLRDVQRIKPDLFNNVFCASRGEFLDIDAKFGDKKNGDYLMSLDTKVNDFLPPNEIERFINTMQQFGKDNGEKTFNNLVDPLVVAVTRKYLQESRREPQLFSMYTSPVTRKGFEYYRKYVEEPGYSKIQYDKDFSKEKNDLEAHDYDFMETAESKSIEDLTEVYNDFCKQKKGIDYTRGFEATKYGKLMEFIRLSEDKIKNIMQELSLPTSIRDAINAKLEELKTKPHISLEEITVFQKEISEELANLPREKIVTVQKYIIEHLDHLQNLGIIKNYQNLFSRFTKHYQMQTEQKPLPTKNAATYKTWYFTDLLPDTNSTIDQKITFIERQTNRAIYFTAQEKEQLSNLGDEQAIAHLTELFNQKLQSVSAPKEGKMHKDIQSLNAVYFEANQAVLFPENGTTLKDLTKKMQDLNLIPDSIKSRDIDSLDELMLYLKAAKIVSDDAQQEKIKNIQRKNSRNMLYGGEIDYEEEEETILEEEME